MINRLITFGDSFTEGEGAWLEKTTLIEKLYKDPSEGRLEASKFNSKFSWPTVLGKLLDVKKVANEGSCGSNNSRIFNRVFEFDKDGMINEEDLVVIMWSSSLREKLPFFPHLFQQQSPVGLGWSLNEVFDSYGETNFMERYYKGDESTIDYSKNTLEPFMKTFFKKYITNSYDAKYYNILNFNFVYFLQEFFKYKKCKYIFIDAFESMNSFNRDYKKWNKINQSHYWNFGKNTAWNYLNNIGGDIFENKELSFNPPGQKCHPNRHGYELIGKELAKFYKLKVASPI